MHTPHRTPRHNPTAAARAAAARNAPHAVSVLLGYALGRVTYCPPAVARGAHSPNTVRAYGQAMAAWAASPARASYNRRVHGSN